MKSTSSAPSSNSSGLPPAFTTETDCPIRTAGRCVGSAVGAAPASRRSARASVGNVIGDRWGVTDNEVARPFPCDEWLRSPTLTAWRGVTVNTTASRLWPWVTQVQLAPYSYDWIDNLGRRSPRTLVGSAEPRVGEPFTRAAGISLGRVLSVDAPYQLTGRIAGAAISYVLDQATDAGCTRLLMKIVSNVAWPLAPLLSVGDLVMARRQLLNWKRLAEAAGPATSPQAPTS